MSDKMRFSLALAGAYPALNRDLLTQRLERQGFTRIRYQIVELSADLRRLQRKIPDQRCPARQQPPPRGPGTVGGHPSPPSAVEQDNLVEDVSGAVFARPRDHQVPRLQRHRSSAGGVVHDDPHRGVRLRRVGM